MTLEQQQLAEALEQNLVLSKQTDHTILDLSDYVDSLEQQLTAALAACKLKDELITDACTAIAFYGEQPPQELFDALSMPCDDSALKAWLGEPVAWRTFDGEGGYDFRSYDDNEDYHSKWDARNPNHKSWVEPLFSPKGLK